MHRFVDSKPFRVRRLPLRSALWIPDKCLFGSGQSDALPRQSLLGGAKWTRHALLETFRGITEGPGCGQRFRLVQWAALLEPARLQIALAARAVRPNGAYRRRFCPPLGPRRALCDVSRAPVHAFLSPGPAGAESAGDGPMRWLRLRSSRLARSLPGVWGKPVAPSCVMKNRTSVSITLRRNENDR